MADRSAEQRAELRSAGQPTAAVPTWFFFQIGVRVGSAECPPHTGNPSRPPMAGWIPETKPPRTPSKLLANSNISGPDRGWRNSPIGSTAASCYTLRVCAAAQFRYFHDPTANNDSASLLGAHRG